MGIRKLFSTACLVCGFSVSCLSSYCDYIGCWASYLRFRGKQWAVHMHRFRERLCVHVYGRQPRAYVSSAASG